MCSAPRGTPAAGPCLAGGGARAEPGRPPAPARRRATAGRESGGGGGLPARRRGRRAGRPRGLPRARPAGGSRGGEREPAARRGVKWLIAAARRSPACCGEGPPPGPRRLPGRLRSRGKARGRWGSAAGGRAALCNARGEGDAGAAGAASHPRQGWGGTRRPRFLGPGPGRSRTCSAAAQRAPPPPPPASPHRHRAESGAPPPPPQQAGGARYSQALVTAKLLATSRLSMWGVSLNSEVEN